jgi:tRNA(Ile)-lysidine synthase
VRSSTSKAIAGPPLDPSLLKPGMCIAVGLSGGADSVALLHILVKRSKELGLVVHAAHLHHGLRGEEADIDLAFCRELAEKLGVPFHEARADTAVAAAPDSKTNKPRETMEEAARRVRYQWFRQLLSRNSPEAAALDAVATAHTLDDQAETVLAKFLRGAWTEGLAGISPKLEFPEGTVVRPILSATRAQIEAYLRALGQDWREDSSNRHLSFMRNRIRHELLPLLEGWNPRLRQHLTQMADLARDEEAWWHAELARIAPQLLLSGRPVRGGGRAASPSATSVLALDTSRVAALAAALQRRLLRHAAEQFGVSIDFAATESLRSLVLAGRAGQKLELPDGLRAERTPREIRLSLDQGPFPSKSRSAEPPPAYTVDIPGEVDAPAFSLRLRINRGLQSTSRSGQNSQNGTTNPPSAPQTATLRNWKPGDWVWLRYSSGRRKVKEVLERMRVTGTARTLWPVLEIGGRIAWMRGVELEAEDDLIIQAEFTDGVRLEPAKMPYGNGG